MKKASDSRHILIVLLVIIAITQVFAQPPACTYTVASGAGVQTVNLNEVYCVPDGGTFSGSFLVLSGGHLVFCQAGNFAGSVQIDPGGTLWWNSSNTNFVGSFVNFGADENDPSWCTGCTNPTINGTAPNSRCGTGTVDISATASAGIVNWWTAASGGSQVGAGSPWITPVISSTTTYYAEAQDGACTSASRTAVTATVVNPTANAGGNQSVCAGVSATLNASGGVSYMWSTGETTQSITQDSAATYTVTITDANACTASDEAVLTLYARPNANISSDTICAGFSASLIASGADSYVWNTGGTTTSVTVSPPSTSTYTITATDLNNCTDTAEGVVVVNALPTVDAGANDTISYGAFTTLDASASGDVRYSWTPVDSLVSNGSVDPQTINLQRTTVFVLMVTDSITGCINFDTTLVVIAGGPLAVGFFAPADTNCLNDVATFVALGSGGSGNYTYSWSSSPAGFSGSNDTIVVSPTQTTHYTVEINDGFQTATDEVQLVVNPLPAVVVRDSVICSYDSIAFDAGAGFAYLWHTGETTQLITSKTAGLYTVTITDDNGCTASDDAQLTIHQAPIVSIRDTAICLHEQTTFDAGAGYAYAWSTGDTVQSVTCDVADKYKVTIIDGNNCSASDEAVLVVNQLPAVSIRDTAICLHEQAVFDAGAGFVYTWSTGDTLQTITHGASATYIVTITDINSCTASDGAVLTVNPLPTVSIRDTAICLYEQATFDAGAADSYVWNTGDTVPAITRQAPATYSVTITDGNSCTASDAAVLTVFERPAGKATQLDSVCHGQDIALQLQDTDGQHTYNWYADAVGSEVINMGTSYALTKVFESDTFYVETTAMSTGCVSTDRFVVILNMKTEPVAFFTIKNGRVIEGESVQFVGNESVRTVSWNWDFGDGHSSDHVDPQHTYMSYGYYPVTLVVTGPSGCLDTNSLGDLLRVHQQPEIFIPSAFTPNQDGYNDVFLIRGRLATFKLIIYNQWGLVVFQSDDADIGWDGSYKGQDAPEGNYVYLFEGITYAGVPVGWNGLVTLIR